MNCILEEAISYEEELTDIRRTIHKNPEAGFEEYQTAKLVSEYLKSLGINVLENVAHTGVVGLLKGSHPGKTILLRADMDCLLMPELTEVEYKSTKANHMHACGHDAHTAWLLGAAKILSSKREQIHGNIKFIFQPAEEIGEGAIKMIEEGILENPKVDFAVAAHSAPEVPTGMIAVSYGTVLAAWSSFKIEIIGKGSGGASPHKSIDPISLGFQVYESLQHIISRKIDPSEPVVLSVCKVNSGTANNVIPGSLIMEGTVRTKTIDSNIIKDMMEKAIKSVVESNNGKYVFDFTNMSPCLKLDSNISEFAEESCKQLLGTNKVIKLNNAGMGSEDFAFISERVPSSYLVIGTGSKEKNILTPAHNSLFDIDDEALPIGSAVLSRISLDYLKGKK